MLARLARRRTHLFGQAARARVRALLPPAQRLLRAARVERHRAHRRLPARAAQPPHHPPRRGPHPLDPRERAHPRLPRLVPLLRQHLLALPPGRQRRLAQARQGARRSDPRRRRGAGRKQVRRPRTSDRTYLRAREPVASSRVLCSISAHRGGARAEWTPRHLRRARASGARVPRNSCARPRLTARMLTGAVGRTGHEPASLTFCGGTDYCHLKIVSVCQSDRGPDKMYRARGARDANGRG
mmetsp:Transcript_34106/g.112442  ORF Transcript_34106/g.112442 Transcript_34106/m.112442 type:complete len:241 (-) Transcript_34106:1405-2127(-)